MPSSSEASLIFMFEVLPVVWTAEFPSVCPVYSNFYQFLCPFCFRRSDCSGSLLRSLLGCSLGRPFHRRLGGPSLSAASSALPRWALAFLLAFGGTLTQVSQANASNLFFFTCANIGCCSCWWSWLWPHHRIRDYLEDHHHK